MNTVKKGNKFEKKCRNLILTAIKDEKFAFPLEYAKVIQKAKYYSKTREKEIIFDLAIEIWPPESKNYSLLYIIECKSYSTKKVPIGDLNKLAFDVNDIAQLNGKAVFITDSSYTTTELTVAKNLGMMLIEVDNKDSLTILLHKKNKSKKEKSNKTQIKQFENFIKNVFNPLKIRGLRKLSSNKIEEIAISFLRNFKPSIISNYEKYELQELIDYIDERHSIKTIFKDLSLVKSKEGVIASYNKKNQTIFLDDSLKNTKRLGFVLAHEVGHSILHSEVMINNELYNEFSDSEYDFVSDRHLLTNYKHWIEWQANKFAACLLIPSSNLKVHLVLKQMQLGISKYGHIYLDKQPINQKDFRQIIDYLTVQFNASRTSIEYRLRELYLITYDNRNTS